MSRKSILGFAVLTGCMLQIGCSDDQPPAMTIAALSPAYAVPLDTIEVIGTNFSATPQENIVTFTLDREGTILEASANKLKVIVPQGAVTGQVMVQTQDAAARSTEELEILVDIPREGLVAFYPFNNHYKDMSGHHYHFGSSAANKRPVFDVDHFGNTTKAIKFDGVDDEQTVADINIGSPVTVGFWIKYGQQFQGGIFGTRVNTQGIGASLDGDGNFDVYIDNQVVYNYAGFLPANSPQWIFISVSFSGSSMKVYKDGQLRYTSPGAGTVATTGSFRIGAITQGGGLYSGSLDDVTVYDRVLSDTEVLQLYNQTLTKYK